MKKIIIWFFALLPCIIVQGQTPFDHVVPPTPTAASLIKFTDIPVSLYTGVPNIEIPLYDVKSKSLGMSISLKYHGAGIKIDEDPGWLGHGWALDAGGTISRTVMGKADELTNGYIEFSKYFPSPTSIGSWASMEKDTLHQMAPDPNESFSYMNFDAEPDIFYFNYPGNSGKFVFTTDRSGNSTIQTIPQQNIKIIPTLNPGSKYFEAFKIIAEDGTQYIYGTDGVRSGIDTNEGNGAQTPVTSGWQLIDMISCDLSDTIKFSYSQAVYNNVSHRLDQINLFQDSKGLTCSLANVCNSDNYQHVDISSNNTTMFISKITTSDCEITFTTTSGFPTQLTSIDISNKINLIRTFNFVYTSGTQYLLNDITESNNGVAKPPYKFDYSDITLPDNTSTAVDYWGYFNGQTSNSYKIPSQWVGTRYYNLGNLSPSSTFVKAGSLTKITYPTGGYSEFTFESNDYKLDQPEVVYSATSKTVTASCGNGATACCMGDGILNTGTFTLDKSQTVSLTVTIAQVGSHYLKLDDQTYQASTTSNVQLAAGTHTIQAHADCGGNVSIKVDYMTSTSGTVKNKIGGGLRIKRIVHYDGISHSNDIIKDYKYSLFSDTTLSSGVLLSGVPRYADDYYYHKIMECVPMLPGGLALRGDLFCHYIRLSSNPVFTLGSINGSPIVYSNVTEYDGGQVSGTTDGKNGKTESVFSLYLPSFFDNFPYAPQISYDWKNGLLLEKKTYNKNGIKVKKENNAYAINESLSNTTRTQVSGIKARYYYRGQVDPTIYSIMRQCYNIPVGSALLKQKADTLYDSNGANPVSSLENYSYSTFLLSKKTVSTSDNKNITNYTLYPHDYATGTGFVNDMNTNHILKPIETITYKSDADGTNVRVTGGSLTEYKTGSHLGLPDNIYKIKTDNPISIGSFRFSNSTSTGLNGTLAAYSRNDTYYEKKYTFDFNSNGNLIQQSKIDDVPASFIWGYNQTYPVVKIDGKAISDIDGSIITGIGSHTFTGGTSFTDINADITWLKTQLSTLLNDKTYRLTFYTYAPLFGMTSSTDPNGVTMYYEYDTLGRLKCIKDDDGRILKTYDYHYYNQ